MDQKFGSDFSKRGTAEGWLTQGGQSVGVLYHTYGEDLQSSCRLHVLGWFGKGTSIGTTRIRHDERRQVAASRAVTVANAKYCAVPGATRTGVLLPTCYQQHFYRRTSLCGQPCLLEMGGGRQQHRGMRRSQRHRYGKAEPCRQAAGGQSKATRG